MSKDPDERLVRACRNGDRAAFETLLARYERPVYNVAIRMLRHPEDARDVAQTTFLKAFEKLEQFDFGHRFYSWIYRIAINESINFLHSRQRHAPLDDVAECVDENDGPPEAYGNAELHRRVQAAMMTLSPEHRAVITLRHFTECSYQDIANVLGIPERTVKSRLFDARRLLRGQLADDGTGAP